MKTGSFHTKVLRTMLILSAYSYHESTNNVLIELLVRNNRIVVDSTWAISLNLRIALSDCAILISVVQIILGHSFFRIGNIRVFRLPINTFHIRI